MEYHRHKLEKNVNNWLYTNYENQQDKVYLFDERYNDSVPYCHGDFVNNFVDEIVEYLSSENYNINNVNVFKDDIILFLYNYTNDKSRK